MNTFSTSPAFPLFFRPFLPAYRFFFRRFLLFGSLLLVWFPSGEMRGALSSSAGGGGPQVEQSETEDLPDRPIELEMLWYRFADPGAVDPAVEPTQALPHPGDAWNNDLGEVGGESATFSSDSQLVLTTSRSNARSKDDETPLYVHERNGNTSHLRLWDIQGNLLWDRARSRGPDEVDNETGNPPPDGLPDDLPPDNNDELEHAEFTVHESNRDRYVVAGGEDDVIEVWEVRDADGNTLAEPNFVREMTIPGGRDAAFDSLGFNATGELLGGGTEYFGTLEVWRATGHPSTWEHVGFASHGGAANGKAVNEFDFSDDSEFLVTAGTDQNGGFWKVHITREETSGEITAVTFDRLATMPQPRRSAKAARIEPKTGRHAVIGSKDQIMYVFDTERLKTGDDTPVMELRNGIYHGVDRMTGVEIEPGAYSRGGRFLVNGGGPEEHFQKHPTTANYQSSFFRIFETAQIQQGAPEPDPVWVQPAFHTEFFFFNTDDSLLATSHDDGTVRIWNSKITGAETIAAEGFNELTQDHSRWTLTGGGSEWEVTHDRPDSWDRGLNSSPPVPQNANWAGHRGTRYLGADNLGGQLAALELAGAWDLTGYTDIGLVFAAAAIPGEFETGDFLRLLADTNDDDTFETTVAEFLPDSSGNLALNGDGRALTAVFEDFVIDLGALLPEDFAGSIRFRIEAQNDSGDEEMAFDSLRVYGKREVPLTGLYREPNGDIRLEFDTFSRFEYEIYFTNFLGDPFSLATMVTGTGSTLSWTDDGAYTDTHPALVPERYYRVLVGCL